MNRCNFFRRGFRMDDEQTSNQSWQYPLLRFSIGNVQCTLCMASFYWQHSTTLNIIQFFSISSLIWWWVRCGGFQLSDELVLESTEILEIRSAPKNDFQVQRMSSCHCNGATTQLSWIIKPIILFYNCSSVLSISSPIGRLAKSILAISFVDVFHWKMNLSLIRPNLEIWSAPKNDIQVQRIAS